jgi:hypothetical protein
VAVEFEWIDKGKDRIDKEIALFKKGFTAVGYPGKGTTSLDGSIDLVDIAVIHEYGSEANNIPARPFMQMTLDKSHKEARDILATMYKKVLKGHTTAREALSIVGEWYTGMIKHTLVTGAFIPLKPATIAAKKSSRPLIDTGQLRNSVTHKETF